MQTSEVRIQNGQCMAYLWGFKRDRKADVDLIIYSPMASKSDFNQNATKIEARVDRVLSALPPADADNLILVARHDLKLAVEPIYKAWLAEQGYAAPARTKPQMRLEDWPEIAPHIAAVITSTLGVETLDGLADADDTLIERCPVENIASYRTRAQRWLARAQPTDAAPVDTEAAQLAQMELEDLRSQLEESKRLLAEMAEVMRESVKREAKADAGAAKAEKRAAA